MISLDSSIWKELDAARSDTDEILVILGVVLRVIPLAVCTGNTKYIENAIGRGN